MATILIVRTDLSDVDTAGYNSQEVGLARALSRRGHSVKILTAGDQQSVEQFKAGSGEAVELIRCPVYVLPFINMPVYKGFDRILKNYKIDIVHVNEDMSPASYQAARYAWRRSIEFVVYQGMYKSLSGRVNLIYEKVNSALLRPFIISHVKLLLAKTAASANFAKENGYRNVFILPVGVDILPFEAPEDNCWRTTLGISEEKKVILYVGSLEERRNPLFLLSVLARLPDEYVLVIVGRGSLSGQLAEKSKSIPGRVFIVDFVAQRELPSLYKEAFVFLLPSSYEIFGMVVLESLLFGVPVISTATAGPSQIISDEKLGRIIDGLDVEQWLKAIKHFDNPSLELSSYRSLHVHDNYTWDSIAKNYVLKVLGEQF
ncbi:MAG: glycosyltransferase family 4 protein [Marinobacter sp.]|nr:glycosyltransferase family 4 protein [Marinobacter sp.]